MIEFQLYYSAFPAVLSLLCLRVKASCSIGEVVASLTFFRIPFPLRFIIVSDLSPARFSPSNLSSVDKKITNCNITASSLYSIALSLHCHNHDYHINNVFISQWFSGGAALTLSWGRNLANIVALTGYFGYYLDILDITWTVQFLLSFWNYSTS